MKSPGPVALEATGRLTPADLVDTPGRYRSATFLAARFVLGAAAALSLIASVWYRSVDLGNVPGINGDEAWYGVQIESMLAGAPVRWLTPSRLPLNPIHVIPLALLLKAYGPAFWVLRAPSLATGLLLLPLSYFLLSRVLDRFTALLATLLLAANPALIAHSRFGWDASHSPLISLLIPAFALMGRELATFAALMVALVVHPTNVFLTPVAVLPLLALDGPPGRVMTRRDRPGSSVFDVAVPDRQLLVWNESYHPGWTVTIDGRPRAAVRVNFDFLGCLVPPGRHTVAFRFRPRSFQVGALASAAGLAFLIGMLAIGKRDPPVPPNEKERS
jgi:hypothetical protein